MTVGAEQKKSPESNRSFMKEWCGVVSPQSSRCCTVSCVAGVFGGIVGWSELLMSEREKRSCGLRHAHETAAEV